jgi:hypothetical protein
MSYATPKSNYNQTPCANLKAPIALDVGAVKLLNCQIQVLAVSVQHNHNAKL